MIEIGDTEKVFFTSDHHFHHKNIIRYTDRPFLSLDHMHDVFVKNWNATVGINDTVYHLGDFSFSRNVDDVKRVMSLLNGNISLLALPWHHDGGWLEKCDVIVSANGEYVTLLPAIYVLSVPWMKKDGYTIKVTLSHYPMAEWEASHYGAWLLHGHSHGSWYDRSGRNVMDVGVDSNNYSPVSLADVIERMDLIDFHKEFVRGN